LENNAEIEKLKQELSKYISLTIDDLMKNALAGKSKIDQDTLGKMNLLMLLDAKTNSLDKENLQNQLDQITDKIVTDIDLPTNGTLLFGEDMYSGQIYTSESLIAARENAIDNNLSIFNVTECEKKLREMYNMGQNDTIMYVTPCNR
jgi:hypothetical protein